MISLLGIVETPNTFTSRFLQWLFNALVGFVVAVQFMFVGLHFGENSHSWWWSDPKRRPSPRSPLGLLLHVPLFALEVFEQVGKHWSQLLHGAVPARAQAATFIFLWWYLSGVGVPGLFTVPGGEGGAAPYVFLVLAMFVYVFRVFTWTDHANHLVSAVISPLIDLPLIVLMVVCIVGGGVVAWRKYPVAWSALNVFYAGLVVFAPALLTGTKQLPWNIWRQTLEEILRASVPASVLAPHHWKESERLFGFALSVLSLGGLARIALSDSKWLRGIARLGDRTAALWVTGHFAALFTGYFFLCGHHHIVGDIAAAISQSKTG